MSSKSYGQKIHDESIKSGSDPIPALIDALDVLYMKYNSLLIRFGDKINPPKDKKSK